MQSQLARERIALESRRAYASSQLPDLRALEQARGMFAKQLEALRQAQAEEEAEGLRLQAKATALREELAQLRAAHEGASGVSGAARRQQHFRSVMARGGDSSYA